MTRLIIEVVNESDNPLLLSRTVPGWCQGEAFFWILKYPCSVNTTLNAQHNMYAIKSESRETLLLNFVLCAHTIIKNQYNVHADMHLQSPCPCVYLAHFEMCNYLQQTNLHCDLFFSKCTDVLFHRDTELDQLRTKFTLFFLIIRNSTFFKLVRLNNIHMVHKCVYNNIYIMYCWFTKTTYPEYIIEEESVSKAYDYALC